MVEMLEIPEVGGLELAPKNPLPFRRQLKAVRSRIDGPQALLDAGGPVTRVVLGPKWLLPNLVFIATPQGARDLLGRTDEVADRGRARMAVELRALRSVLELPVQRANGDSVRPLATQRHGGGIRTWHLTYGWRGGAR